MTSLAEWPPPNLRGWVDAYAGDLLHAALAYGAHEYRIDRNLDLDPVLQVSTDHEFMAGIARGKPADRQGAWAYVADAFHSLVNLLHPGGAESMPPDVARQRVEYCFQLYAVELDEFQTVCGSGFADDQPVHEWVRRLTHPAVGSPEAFTAHILLQHEPPLNHPLDRLRHTVALFASRPDDDLILEATGVGVYPEQPVTGDRTGLTMGDLRALHQRLVEDQARLRRVGDLMTQQGQLLTKRADQLTGAGLGIEMVVD